MSKFQAGIDLESENRAELARMEREAIDVVQRNIIRSKIEKSDEKIQSLAVMMLHYCSGLQNCLDSQEEQRLQGESQVQPQGQSQGQGHMVSQVHSEGESQTKEVGQIESEGHGVKEVGQNDVDGMTVGSNGDIGQSSSGQGQSSDDTSILTSSSGEHDSVTASANHDGGFTIGVPVIGKVTSFQVGPEENQTKPEEFLSDLNKDESIEVIRAEDQSISDECNISVETPESSAQKS